MRFLFGGVVLTATFLMTSGCSDSQTVGPPVATTEDEYAAYDALIAEDQAQTASDETEAAK